MIKKVIAMVLTTALIFSLTACGGAAPEGEKTEEDTQAAEGNSESTKGNGEKTVINYYTWESNEENNPVIEEFMAKNPDIEVKVHVLPDSMDTQTKLDVMAMGGSEIDVMQVADGQQFAKAQGGILLNLDSYIEADGIDMNTNFGGYEPWAKYDGSYYCYPRHTSVGCVFYNKDLFDEMGVAYPEDDWTYADYEEKAYALTHGEGGDKVYGTFNHIRPGFWCLPAIQKQDFYTADGMCNIGAEEFITDLERRKKLDDDGIEKSYSEITATNTLQNNEFFNEYCAMVMAASWMVRDMKDKESYPYDFEVGVANFPRYDETVTGTPSWGSVSALAIPATSENPDAAWKFIRYYVENGSMNIAKTGNIPVYLPSYSDEMVEVFVEGSGLSIEEGEKFFNPDLDAFMKMPLGEAMVEYNSILQEETSLYFTDSKSLEDTVKDIVDRTNQAIEKERAETD